MTSKLSDWFSEHRVSQYEQSITSSSGVIEEIANKKLKYSYGPLPALL